MNMNLIYTYRGWSARVEVFQQVRRQLAVLERTPNAGVAVVMVAVVVVVVVVDNR